VQKPRDLEIGVSHVHKLKGLAEQDGVRRGVTASIASYPGATIPEVNKKVKRKEVTKSGKGGAVGGPLHEISMTGPGPKRREGRSRHQRKLAFAAGRLARLASALRVPRPTGRDEFLN